MVASIVEQLFSWVKLQKRQAILRTPTIGSLSNISPPTSLSESIVITSTVSVQSINQIERLLAAIPRDLLAEAAFNCKAYARAFLHYEHYVREQRNRLNEEKMRSLYHRLQHMYTFADEPDIVDGISTMFTQKSVEQQIFEHETAGRWTAAQTCYELVIEQKPLLKTHIGYINTLRQLGRLGRYD
jgi:serine/threonine-protein kinase ATR